MRVVYRFLRCSLPVYEEMKVIFCCAGMSRQWGKLFGFGVKDVPASTSRQVNLYVDRPQVNDGTILELVPIRHCPFCGEAVETVREK
jgi:hypothetical protein